MTDDLLLSSAQTDRWDNRTDNGQRRDRRSFDPGPGRLLIPIMTSGQLLLEDSFLKKRHRSGRIKYATRKCSVALLFAFSLCRSEFTPFLFRCPPQRENLIKLMRLLCCLLKMLRVDLSLETSI